MTHVTNSNKNCRITDAIHATASPFMILMGYIMVKIKFLKEEDSKVISKIILYLIVPSVIITAFQVDYTPSIMKGLAVAWCFPSFFCMFS